jgi:hypothetical protein
MQREAWTDERLMNQGFAGLRTEFQQEVGELRGLMWRLQGGIIAAIVAAILLRGF